MRGEGMYTRADALTWQDHQEYVGRLRERFKCANLRWMCWKDSRSSLDMA